MSAGVPPCCVPHRDSLFHASSLAAAGSAQVTSTRTSCSRAAAARGRPQWAAPVPASASSGAFVVVSFSHPMWCHLLVRASPCDGASSSIIDVDVVSPDHPSPGARLGWGGARFNMEAVVHTLDILDRRFWGVRHNQAQYRSTKPSTPAAVVSSFRKQEEGPPLKLTARRHRRRLP